MLLTHGKCMHASYGAGVKMHAINFKWEIATSARYSYRLLIWTIKIYLDKSFGSKTKPINNCTCAVCDNVRHLCWRPSSSISWCVWPALVVYCSNCDTLNDNIFIVWGIRQMFVWNATCAHEIIFGPCTLHHATSECIPYTYSAHDQFL